MSTQSPVLASKIKDYYFKLRQTLDVADLSPKEIREANKKAQDGEIVLQDQEDSIDSLPAKWSDLQDKHFPLFLSFEHLCALLEADLKIARLQGHALQEERKRARQAMQVRICSREDQDSNIDDMAIDSTDAFTLSTRAVDRSAWIHQVDAQTFQDVYWPHFDENLTKGLNSVLCYAEFVGVIQGSEGALSTERVSF